MTGAVLALAGCAGGSGGGGGGGGAIPDTSWANIFSQYAGNNPAVTLSGFTGTGSIAASLSGSGTLFYVKNGTYATYAGAFAVEAGDTLSWGVAAVPGGSSISGTATITSGGATIDTFTYHIVVSPGYP